MDEVTTKEMTEALQRSGYFLESRILNVLAGDGYKNFPNQSYPDNLTNKSREIDVLAESERITDHLMPNGRLQFEYWHRLVIECINNLQPVVFFKRPDKEPYTIFEKFYYSNIHRPIKEGYRGLPPDGAFHEFTTESERFHYNRFLRNSQYCSFTEKRKGKEKEWMASHPDGLHDTFNKLANFTHLQNIFTNDWMKQSSAWRGEVFTIIFFPVLVFQNELYEVSESHGAVKLEPKNHLVFEFKQYSDKREGLLIDIITESYLPDYIQIVKEGITTLKATMMKFYEDKDVVSRQEAMKALKKNQIKDSNP